MSAQDKLGKLVDSLESGRTVLIATCTRCTKITPRTYAKWSKAGHTLFKTSGDNLYMANGNKFVCIDYCNIRIQ